LKINADNIERLLKKQKVSAEKFAERLDMSGTGFRKILKTGSTTESTAKDIAFHLKVHLSAITSVDELEWQEGEANDVYKEIHRHEKIISRLKNHIIELYKLAGKEMTPQQIDDMDKL
jgi:hypothetical protein